jgi:hypothetical protein
LSPAEIEEGVARLAGVLGPAPVAVGSSPA